jgi:putative SOS response-associated peptidase YedK
MWERRNPQWWCASIPRRTSATWTCCNGGCCQGDKGTDEAQRPINARSETAATSGLFRGALKARRCIVPADVFYEWKAIEGGKVALCDRAARWAADGVCRSVGGLPLAGLDRYPQLNHHDHDAERRDGRSAQQNAGDPGGSRLACMAWRGGVDPSALLHPSPDGTLKIWPVNKRVGSPRNNDAELIKPIAES